MSSSSTFINKLYKLSDLSTVPVVPDKPDSLISSINVEDLDLSFEKHFYKRSPSKRFNKDQKRSGGGDCIFGSREEGFRCAVWHHNLQM